LYKRLFERTVQRINDSFREMRPESTEDSDGDAWNHIGILDIYGFERLQRNSFEQLCINLANERLQQYFVENVLVAEQSLYKREGLPWVGLSLPDSQPVVNCIAQVFRTLDEYSQQLAKGFETASDEKFCQKTVDEAMKCPQRKEVLKQLKMSGKRRSTAGPAVSDGFVIRHYAGPVEYSTKGWLDKNNDRLLAECETLICESTSPLVKSLGEEDQGKAVFRSISKKYTTDLEALLKTLSTCNLHYIRCFKPNEEQKPDVFRHQLVLDQIIQCGTIELVKLMHDGYPNRCPFEEITARFKDLLPESFQRYGMRTFIEALMMAYEVPRDDWALGMSRLFLKAGQLRALENMRSEGATPKADKLAQIVSAIIRKRWGRAGNAVRLCNYIPKLISQIYVQRAARAVSRTVSLTARLAPRRRLLGGFRAVRFALSTWDRIRRKRVERLAAALRLAHFLHSRTRPWLLGARERARDAAARRRAEEERQRLERQRMAEERKQLEEERLRLEAERLEREKEERQREDARAQELEREREEQRQKLEEDRKMLEQERRAFEQERRLSILAVASPQHAKPAPMEESAQTERSQMPAREPQPAPADAEVKSTVTPQLSTAVGAEDEIYPGDSVSALLTSQASALVQQEIAVQMNERIHALEREMAQKQEEVLQQMRFLQQKNESLERTLEEERAQKDFGGHAQRTADGMEPSASPPQRRNPSLIPLDDNTPEPATPLRSSAKKSRYSRSERRYSLISSIDIGSTGRCHQSNSSKAAGRERRFSIAHEALSSMRDDGLERTHRIGDAPIGTGDLHSQRKWWDEQRRFLLEDLYPSGSPGGAFGQTPGRGTARRKSQAEGACRAAQQAQAPAVTAGEREQRGAAPPAAAASSGVRDLNTMFEHVEDSSSDATAALQPCQEEEPGKVQQPHVARAARKTEYQDSKLKKPQYFWNKRHSVGDADRGHAPL